MLKYRIKGLVLIFIISFLFIPSNLAAAEKSPFGGHWTGTIKLPGTELEFDIDFTKKPDGTWQGDISIPAQNARNLPLSSLVLKPGEVSFKIADVPGEPTFKGTLNPDGKTISGDFTQNTQTFPFSMSKGKSFSTKAKKALSGFEDIVQKGLKGLNVPGVAVAVIVEDEVILAKGYGYRNIEKEKPMTADTLLAIGSSSKAFTTFAMGSLADQGKLDWEEPVRTYIPWFRLYDPFASEHLTPRDLVTHRAGRPRHDLVWYNNSESSRKELVQKLDYLKPTADLRTRFQYNNLMFLTAGYLVEVLTGKTWENAVRALVLDPLGMKRTNFSVNDSQKDPDHALPYRESKGKIERIPFRNITTMGPAGAINSSVSEMARWVIVHLNHGKNKGEQILNPQTVQDMHLAHMPTGNTPVLAEVTPSSYGMGWFVDNYRGHSRVHHGGNIDGFSALISFFPKDGIGFVVLANKNGTSLPELLVRHAADLILGYEKNWLTEAIKQKEKGKEMDKEAREKKSTRQVKGTNPAHSLSDYEGLYMHPGYGSLSVFLKKENIYFTFNDITTLLKHWHYETFNSQRGVDPTFEDMKLTFRTDVNGQVASFEAPFEPTMDEIVFTKQPNPCYFDPAFLQKFVGKYSLTGQTITISLKGKNLTAYIPGQPEYELIPTLGDEFTMKQLKVIQLKFKIDKTGTVTALVLIQPEGIYEAKRVKK